MNTTRSGRGPDATSVEAAATTKTSTRLDAPSVVDPTATPSNVDRYSMSSRLMCARHYLEPLIAQAREDRPLPAPGTTEWVVADHLTKYAAVFAAYLPHLEAQALSGLVASRNRREAREDRCEFLVAQREASHEISKAVDWSAQSRRPSHSELVERRSVVVVPQ